MLPSVYASVLMAVRLLAAHAEGLAMQLIRSPSRGPVWVQAPRLSSDCLRYTVHLTRPVPAEVGACGQGRAHQRAAPGGCGGRARGRRP